MTTLEAMRKMKRRRLRDVAEEVVCKVVGRVKLSGRGLTAPLTGRRCAWWAVCTLGVGHAPPVPEVTRLIHWQEAIDFYVEDDTGRALVRVQAGTPTMMALDHVHQFARDEDFQAFVRGRGAEPERWAGVNPCLAEGAIVDGEPVAIVGAARFEVDPAAPMEGLGGYRAPARRFVFSNGVAGAPLLVTNSRLVTK